MMAPPCWGHREDSVMPPRRSAQRPVSSKRSAPCAPEYWRMCLRPLVWEHEQHRPEKEEKSLLAPPYSVCTPYTGDTEA